jgi:vacuolar protein-sorting-associated protein 4
MLAKSVCYHSNAKCFWVSLADITSKYIGESEKLLNILFELAIEEAPSIIIIDEMDSLGRTRTGNESECERRIKTEFLKQMDKIKTIKNIKKRVSVFATTNMPWQMDVAALRRFERKVLVPMPNQEAREKILKLCAGKHHTLSDEDFTLLAKNTDGYSGSDLSTLVNDGLMRPIKDIQDATHFKKVQRDDLISQGLITPEEDEDED